MTFCEWRPPGGRLLASTGGSREVFRGTIRSMSDETGKSGHEPNLELPSLLGFGRKKKKRRGSDQTPAEPVAEDLAEPDISSEPGSDHHAGPLSAPPGGPTPSTERPKRRPPVPPPTTRAQEPTSPVQPSPPPPVPPVTEPFEPPAAPAREPHLLTEEPTGHPAEELDGGPPVETSPPPPDRAGTSLTLLAINPRLATAVTGALVGLVGVLLAFVTGRGCEEVRGVSSCGGFGLIALLIIVSIMVVLGAAVLKAWRIYDPVSTSFLGVGLVAVFVMLFLLSSLESIWMLLVIPALGALTFVLSRWVAETFVEDGPGSNWA